MIKSATQGGSRPSLNGLIATTYWEIVMTDSDCITRATISEFPGYQVDSTGVVWSCWKSKGRGRGIGVEWRMSNDWRPLKQHPCGGGGKYLFVRLYNRANGVKKQFTVHRLVLVTFAGPPPAGTQCLHGDGNPHNNSIENLRWGTAKENASDREKHKKRGKQCQRF